MTEVTSELKGGWLRSILLALTVLSTPGFENCWINLLSQNDRISQV